MYPRLFEIGPFTIYSYGLMLGIAFIVASYLLTLEMRRKQLDPHAASTITLLAVVFGIIGAKLLYLIESWEYFLRDPIGMAFSPGGLTWYGGFILAAYAVWKYAKKKNIPFLTICDATAPGLMIGYGIARIGCHLSGDGDYGFPTDLPWAAVYSKGTYPPSVAFKDFPEVVAQYGVNGVVPDDILVHPTPIYEFLAAAAMFAWMWFGLRKKNYPPGKLFMIYLVLSGVARFLVEFLRLNPRLVLGLSESQIISFLLVVVGTYGVLYFNKRTATQTP
jgi:phosphatidylglycerol:prolipoprotein diacylglycerol transferase